MDFISENTESKKKIFFCLVIWSIASCFPVYAFSLIGMRTSGMSVTTMENMAQLFALFTIFIAAVAVYVNRYTHNLLMIERPCRYKGSMQKFFGPGQGFRFKSMRNSMSFFTLTLEFYQTFGLTWSATRMEDLYHGVYDADHLAATGSGSGIPDDEGQCVRPWFGKEVPCEIFTYWMVVCMVMGWVILYSFPAVVTTSTVGNRQFAHNMQEMYRKYLWFMSGAGFLTVLKACMKILFCVPNVYDPDGPMVALTDHSIVCWSDLHLQMVAISLLCLAVFFPSASLTTLFRYDDEDDRSFCGNTPLGSQGGCVLGGEDIRWIHLWRRIEYLVKGIWVFSGMRFAKYGNLACVVLLLGSLIIATANFFMNPANLRFVCRQKLNIHVCNAWTTLTCLWAATYYNTDRKLHIGLCWAGWVVVWLVLWGYEIKLASNSPFRKEIGDRVNINFVSVWINKYKNFIMQSTGMYRWGNHAKIVELLNFCEHPDVEIQRSAFSALADLAFRDQMTTRYSFFLALTTTSPTVNIMIDAIEKSKDVEIQNLATRILNSFLQTNTSNTFGVFASFHETLQSYDEAKDGMVPIIVSQYAKNSKGLHHKIDAIQLALEMSQSDSNDIPAVASNVLPMLKEWVTSGNIVQQYFSCQLMVFVANRYDCAQMVMDEIGAKSIIELFQAVAESYGRFEATSDGKVTEVSDFGHKSGGDNTVPRRLKVPMRLLPKKLKRLLILPGLCTGEAEETLDVPDDAILEENHIRMMQADILEFIVDTLVDCSFALGAEGKKDLIDSGILSSVITTCLTFDATTRESDRTDNIDRQLTTALHVEGCRITQYLLSHGFSLSDIHHDDEMVDYLHQLRNFLEGEDTKDAEVHVFDSLTAVQRRKVHLVAEFLALNHISDGPPTRRNVLVTKPGEIGNNPVFRESMKISRDPKRENDLADMSPRSAMAFNADKKMNRLNTSGMTISMDMESAVVVRSKSIDQAETEMKQSRSRGEVAPGVKLTSMKDSGDSEVRSAFAVCFILLLCDINWMLILLLCRRTVRQMESCQRRSSRSSMRISSRWRGLSCKFTSNPPVGCDVIQDTPARDWSCVG